MKENSDHNFIFPNIEEVYDLDIENLKLVKEKIVDTIDLDENLNDNLDDSDLINNFNSDEFLPLEYQKKKLKKLYNFVCAELKERNYFDEVLDFFMNKDSLDKITQNLLNDDYESTHANSYKSEENLDIKIIETQENNLKGHHKTFSNCDNYIKPVYMDIKSILQRTKLDDNFKLIVGQSSLVRNIKTAQPRKKQNNILVQNTNIKNLRPITSYKEAPIKINYNINLDVNYNIVKKKKLNKIRKASPKNNIENELTNLELRKQYIVPNIKTFIKKKTNLNFQLIKEDIHSINQTYQINSLIKDIQYVTKVKEDFVDNKKLEIVVKNKHIINRRYNSEINIINNKNPNSVTINENKINSNKKLLVKLNNNINNEKFINSENTENLINFNENNNNGSSIDIQNEYQNIPIKENDDIQILDELIQVSKINKIHNKKINDESSIVTNPDNLQHDKQSNLINLENNYSSNEIIKINNTNYNNETEYNNKSRQLIFSTQISIDQPKYENHEEILCNFDYIDDRNELLLNCKINLENITNTLQEENNFDNNLNKLEEVGEENNSLDCSLENLIIKQKFPIPRNNKINENNENSNFNKTNSDFIITKNLHTKKNSTGTNFFLNKDTITRKQSAIKQRARSKSSKMPLIKHIQSNNINNINLNIPDYSKIYKNFNQIFNGYYLHTETSIKPFNINDTMSHLLEYIKSLSHYENSDTKQKEKREKLNTNIIESEAEMIKNRLRQVSDKLLTDHENLIGERYYVFKKILELQKKEYGKRRLNIDEEITNKMYFRVVLSRPEIYDIMCYTLGLREEWSELPHGMLLGQSWNLLWTYCTPNIDMSKIFSFQKVNHMINNRMLSRKDLLKKAIDRVRKINQKLNKLFEIMPNTYILSRDYVDFVDEFTRIKNSGINPNHNLWIVKPVGKSRGRGIYVINDISEVPLSESFLVQKYLTNPLLINGYKFDLRIYVVVTSVNPLEAFLYKDGFARVSNSPFSLNNNDRLVHLTNASVQNKIAKKNSNYEKVYGGSKISLEMLKNKLLDKGINFDDLIWPQIKEIIIKSLVACQYEMPYTPSCFELFGYDVIIDRDLKCWLLEVNSSPSLERSNVLDDQIKLTLVDDVLNLVDPINFDRKSLIEVLERRMNINNNTRNDVYLYSPQVQLNIDLNKIFNGKIPREFGEMPERLGNFERIAPSEISDKFIKMTGGQKLFGNKN